jgi:hypothetical protein
MIHEHQEVPIPRMAVVCFPTSQYSETLLVEVADAKRLLTRVQGILELAREDTSRGVPFILLISCSSFIVLTLTNAELQHRGFVSTTVAITIPIVHLFLCCV